MDTNNVNKTKLIFAQKGHDFIGNIFLLNIFTLIKGINALEALTNTTTILSKKIIELKKNKMEY